MSWTRLDSLGLIGYIVGSILVFGIDWSHCWVNFSFGVFRNGFCLLKRKRQWVDEGVLQGNGQRCALGTFNKDISLSEWFVVPVKLWWYS